MKLKNSSAATTNPNNFSNLKMLFPESESQKNEKIVYRKNGKSIDKIIEFDTKTGLKIKTTFFDYFDDKKIRSIDEFDKKTGKKTRTINYVLYKSIDEFDIESGKKLRTINFCVKDENKISSIQEYDLETGKIVTVSIYKRDGKTISIIKKIDPVTEKVTNWVDNSLTKSKPIENISFPTRCYDNIPEKNINDKEDIAKLIDNLFSCNF